MRDPIFFNYFSGSPLLLNDPLEHLQLQEEDVEQLWIPSIEENGDEFPFDTTDPDMPLEMECIGPLLQISPSLEPFFLGALFGDTLIAGEIASQ